MVFWGPDSTIAVHMDPLGDSIFRLRVWGLALRILCVVVPCFACLSYFVDFCGWFKSSAEELCVVARGAMVQWSKV